MSAFKAAILDATLEKVRVVYVDRDTCKWWNMRRNSDDTRMFTGWYWTRGRDEAGPFKTYSAAVRDAYYKFVLDREPPSAVKRTVPTPVKLRRVK